MSFGDGRGPLGQGPMTGRGAGFCAGFALPGNVNATVGRGMGRGGRGWRNQFYATGLCGWQRAAAAASVTAPAAMASSDQELAALKGQAENLQAALDQIRRRIDEVVERQTPK